MPKISEILKMAAEILQQEGIPDPRREARSLLAFSLQKDEAFLFGHPEDEMSVTEADRYATLVNRRAGHEPFQHITGRQEFYGLEFAVSRDVLIPRPETEMLVEESIRILRDSENPLFCEIGVGSGCISVSILHHLGSAAAVGLDISESALAVAARNAAVHGVERRLELFASDVFGLFSGESRDQRTESRPKFELIVSNPPYVPDDALAGLQPEVREFDPQVALAGGVDGLSIIRRIVAESPEFIDPGGYLLLEIGFDQSDRVQEMFTADVWNSIDVLPDFQGIPRMVRARRSRASGG